MNAMDFLLRLFRSRGGGSPKVGSSESGAGAAPSAPASPRPGEWDGTVGGFHELVVAACRKFGGSVISGVRSARRNRSVSGHPKSRHLLGLACDVVMDDPGTAAPALDWLRARGLHGYVRPGGKSFHVQDRAAAPPTRSA